MELISVDPNLPDHMQRVVVEHNELVKKQQDLKKFIEVSEIYKSLPVAEQGRLVRQHALMSEYVLVLNERIIACYE
jgi:hypothetical protein